MSRFAALLALALSAPALAADGPAWVALDPANDADVSATLASCRAEAWLVGPRGRTQDWRLVDACMQAHGLAPAAEPVGVYLPARGGCVRAAPSLEAAGEALTRCMREATFADASGWPHVNPALASACMAREGWEKATASEWVARTSCAAAPIATR